MKRWRSLAARLPMAGALMVAPAVVVADGAGAQVHGVSQAGCAHDPADSGANHSSDNTPAPPIPVSASDQGQEASGDAASPGSGGDGDPQCDTPAEQSRQDR